MRLVLANLEEIKNINNSKKYLISIIPLVKIHDYTSIFKMLEGKNEYLHTKSQNLAHQYGQNVFGGVLHYMSSCYSQKF